MRYREELPAHCPPPAAQVVTQPRVVFRLVRRHLPGLHDFCSQRAEKPDQPFMGVTECQACGLSVFTELEACKKLLLLRHLQSRAVCKVQLEDGAGCIMQTGRKSAHHTWWPLADFDILAHTGAVL